MCLHGLPVLLNQLLEQLSSPHLVIGIQIKLVWKDAAPAKVEMVSILERRSVMGSDTAPMVQMKNTVVRLDINYNAYSLEYQH